MIKETFFYEILFRYINITSIGDWGLGIGDWAQSPIHNTKSPKLLINKYEDYLHIYILFK